MNLISRLEGSYTVQEQEAAEMLDTLREALILVKEMASFEVLDGKEHIIEYVEKVLKYVDSN